MHILFCFNLSNYYNIKQGKVLREAISLALQCMVVPSGSLKKIGNEHDRNHARVQSCCKQVIYPICWESNVLEAWILGSTQVISLPFQCAEGLYYHQWRNWKKEKQRVNTQTHFEKCVTFKIRCGRKV